MMGDDDNQDREVCRVCADCGGGFSMTYDEMVWFEERDMVPPRRCRECRKFRREQRGRSGEDVYRVGR